MKGLIDGRLHFLKIKSGVNKKFGNGVSFIACGFVRKLDKQVLETINGLF